MATYGNIKNPYNRPDLSTPAKPAPATNFTPAPNAPKYEAPKKKKSSSSSSQSSTSTPATNFTPAPVVVQEPIMSPAPTSETIKPNQSLSTPASASQRVLQPNTMTSSDQISRDRNFTYYALNQPGQTSAKGGQIQGTISAQPAPAPFYKEPLTSISRSLRRGTEERELKQLKGQPLTARDIVAEIGTGAVTPYVDIAKAGVNVFTRPAPQGESRTISIFTPTIDTSTNIFGNSRTGFGRVASTLRTGAQTTNVFLPQLPSAIQQAGNELFPTTQLKGANIAGSLFADVAIGGLATKSARVASKAYTTGKEVKTFGKLSVPVDTAYVFPTDLKKATTYVPISQEFVLARNQLKPVVTTTPATKLPQGFYTFDTKKAITTQEKFNVPVDPYLQQTREFQTQLYPKKYDPVPPAIATYQPTAIQSAENIKRTADLRFFGVEPPKTVGIDVTPQPKRVSYDVDLTLYPTKQDFYDVKLIEQQQRINLLPVDDVRTMNKRGQQSVSLFSRSYTKTPTSFIDTPVSTRTVEPQQIGSTYIDNIKTRPMTRAIPVLSYSPTQVQSTTTFPASDLTTIKPVEIINTAEKTAKNQQQFIVPKTETVQIIEPVVVQEPVSRTKSRTRLSSGQSQVTQQLPIVETAQAQQQKIKFVPSLAMRRPLQQRQAKNKLELPILPPPLVFTSKPSPRERVGQGFDVFARVRGNFEKINVNPLSRSDALNLGGFRADTTAVATFRVQEAKGGIKDTFTSYKFNTNKFYKKNEMFIEKNKYRIDSLGELGEITAKGGRKKRSVFRL
jgi:hypothetical protein